MKLVISRYKYELKWSDWRQPVFRENDFIIVINKKVGKWDD